MNCVSTSKSSDQIRPISIESATSTSRSERSLGAAPEHLLGDEPPLARSRSRPSTLTIVGIPFEAEGGSQTPSLEFRTRTESKPWDRAWDRGGHPFERREALVLDAPGEDRADPVDRLGGRLASVPRRTRTRRGRGHECMERVGEPGSRSRRTSRGSPRSERIAKCTCSSPSRCAPHPIVVLGGFAPLTRAAQARSRRVHSAVQPTSSAKRETPTSMSASPSAKLKRP